MKLKKIAFLFVVIMVASCSKEDAHPEPKETYVFDHIDLLFVDNEGLPLLDTSIDHAIESKQMNVYYVRNEKVIKVKDPFEQTNPGFVRIGGKIPELRFFFGVNIFDEATGELDNKLIGRSVRFIEPYPGDLDTLAADWVSYKGGHALTRITYNKRVVYDSSEGIGDISGTIGYKIVKETAN